MSAVVLSVLLVLLIVLTWPPCTSARTKQIISTDLINSTLPDCWFWCKRCGAAATNWAQAGELWAPTNSGIERLVASTKASPCSAPGFAIHEHGDRKNPVVFKGDKKFLYVSGNVEFSTGAGATICDVENSDGLEYVYTNGLNGCMGLSIIGVHRESGTKDVFFAHLRRWSQYGGVTLKSLAEGRNVAVAENDPLHAAQEFVRSHENLNVFFGSGIHDKFGKAGHYTIESESFLLSQILGVFVANDWYHSLPYKETLGLDIKREALVTLSGTDERVRMFAQDENGDVYKAYKPQPDQNLLTELARLKQRRGSGNLLDCVFALRAYAAGDYDMVETLVKKADKYGYQFQGLLERVSSDMKEKGYDGRLKDKDATAVPSHKLFIPREPR